MSLKLIIGCMFSGKSTEIIKINNRLKVIICGHTDDVGTKNDNLLLSKNRAKSVYSFLIENGTKKNRWRYYS